MSKKFLRKDGVILCVLRPEDPAKAIARARDIKERQDFGLIDPTQAAREFNSMLEEQTYTYEGVAGVDGKTLYDEKSGAECGSIQPGDSFLSLEQVRESFKLQDTAN
jgi:hypothetical protein